MNLQQSSTLKAGLYGKLANVGALDTMYGVERAATFRIDISSNLEIDVTDWRINHE